MIRHVLILPSWYGPEDDGVIGSFFIEMAHAISNKIDRVAFIAPCLRLSFYSYINFDFLLEYREKNIRNITFIRVDLPYKSIAKWICNFLNRAIIKYQIKEYIRRHGKPDILQIHSITYVGKVALWCKRKYAIPYVVTEHSSHFLAHMSRKQKENAGKIINNAKYALAVSTILKDAVQLLVKENQVKVIPNLIDMSIYKNIHQFKNNQQFIIGACGLMTSIKNYTLLIKSFARLSEEIENIYLVIAGNGPDMFEIKTLCSQLGVEHLVSFSGRVKRSEIPVLFSQFDLFVCSSLVETFGVVLIEALACGCPVLSTDCGGPRDIICDVNGMLVNNNDIDAMVDGLRTMYQRISANFYQAEKIKADVESRFSAPVVANQYIELYNNVYN